MPADDVIAAARSWVGVPYLHQGRSRSGVDCIGLVLEICAECGRLPPKLGRVNYGRHTGTDELERRIGRYCELLEEREPGALITFAWGAFAGHVGIFTGANLIHAFNKRGIERVVETSFAGPWLRVHTRAWRLPAPAA